MSHKVHPKIYRIGRLTQWDSRWLSSKNLPKYLEEDFVIREFLKNKLKDSGVENIEIERFPGKISVIISTARPGLIIGRGGEGVEILKKAIGRKVLPSGLSKKDAKKEIKIEIREVKNPWISAALAGQWIANQIEKRMPFRRVIKQALQKIMMNKEAKGARINIGGRLDGNIIARNEWVQQGRLPRQTLRSDIDYAEAKAYCAYGAIGIKVWIYKGEKFE